MRNSLIILALVVSTACLALLDSQMVNSYASNQATAAPTEVATEIAPTPSPTWLPTPVGAVGPFNFPADVNPLTGLPVDDPSVLQHRPLAVKISNAPPLVRPQAGNGGTGLFFLKPHPSRPGTLPA